jgi:hypothetical protein
MINEKKIPKDGVVAFVIVNKTRNGVREIQERKVYKTELGLIAYDADKGTTKIVEKEQVFPTAAAALKARDQGEKMWLVKTPYSRSTHLPEVKEVLAFPPFTAEQKRKYINYIDPDTGKVMQAQMSHFSSSQRFFVSKKEAYAWLGLQMGEQEREVQSAIKRDQNAIKGYKKKLKVLEKLKKECRAMRVRITKPKKTDDDECECD